MTKRVLVGGILVVAVLLGVLALAPARPKEVSADDATPGVYGGFVEVGKEYTFTWPNGSLTATLAETPRGHWVKVKRRERGDRDTVYWFNLNTVMHIRQETGAK